MTASWGEIRRLQATLDAVQSSRASHKLSERNCIEVVNKLIEMGLINVLYTMDGKEYVVNSYLETEIRNELELHEGRINTVDLQQILNIDLVHIQKAVDNIISADSTIELIQGELISSLYKRTLCCQVNEILLQNGNISLADISTTFSLPLNYVTPCIETSLGVLIKGHLDKSGSGLLYTESYVSRHKARIRGTFAAVTQPTPVGPILLRGNYNENLFHSILHELVAGGQLSGTVHGRSDKAIYIPSIYTEMQNEWIDNFLSSNGYLEYDAVGRLGISDPHKYIKQRFKSHDLLMLNSCCLATRVINEVDGCVQEEVRRTEKWVDILPILPVPCSCTDANTLLMTKYGHDQSLLILGSVVSHTLFLRECQQLFKPLITERAKKAAVSSSSFLKQLSKDKDGRGVSEGDDTGKRGGKQKKGKSGRRGKEEVTTQQWEIRFMSNIEISRVLSDKMEDLPETFIEGLVELLSRPLQQLFQEEAKQLLSEQNEGDGGIQRKRHNVLTQQIQELWNRARLFVKGIDKFEGDTRSQLIKYLLKTVCTDMANIMISYVATDIGHKVPEDTPTLNKERLKIIKSLPEPFRQLATDVNISLSGKDVEEFFVKFEKMCFSDNCGLMLKKLDKKKEKQLIFTHQMSLKDSLKEEIEPAMILHLTIVILFQHTNGCLIHTPGRLLPAILLYLQQGMDANDYQLLNRLHDLIIMQLKTTSTNKDIMSTSLKQPLVMPPRNKDIPSVPASKDTPTDSCPVSSIGGNLNQQQDTHSSEGVMPSSVRTTPSPDGEWELVKPTESDVIGSETTMESLQLLEEAVLEEKNAIVDEGTTPLNEGGEQSGNDMGMSGDKIEGAVGGLLTETDVSKDRVIEGVACDVVVSDNDQLESLIKSVKDLVLLKKTKT